MLALVLHVRFLDNKTILKLFVSLCCSLYFGFKFSLILGSRRCPECYGNELCRYFQSEQIQFTWFSLFLSLVNPNLTKSVFYGVFNDTQVVVKRMARRTEKQGAEKVQNFILCPSVRNARFLFDQVKNGSEKRKLWLDLRSSIEPLLLMYFQTKGKWPFPKYHGACGDLIVEEYKGEPLTNFLFSQFEMRSLLAAQLLEMAQLFTFGDSNLAFYFTDYSLDNLVVDSSGKVFLIDLDNVIISNKSAVEGVLSSFKTFLMLLQNLNTSKATVFVIKCMKYVFSGSDSMNRNIHKSEILDDYKYAFSPTDICQYYLSDHNYFSVCKYLLSHPQDGLLKNIPPEIQKHKEVLQLLDECSEPKTMNDRFSAGQKLQILLKEISHEFNIGFQESFSSS